MRGRVCGGIGRRGRRRCRCRGIGRTGRGGHVYGYKTQSEVKSGFGAVVVVRFGKDGVVILD